MKVIINGEERAIPEEFNLDELIRHFSLPSQRVAVELNTAVIRRKDWENVRIKDADKIEVIHLVGGG